MGAARGIGIAAWGIPGGRSAIGLRCQVSSAFLGSSRLGLGAWLDHGEDLGRSTGPARGTPAEIARRRDRLGSRRRGSLGAGHAPDARPLPRRAGDSRSQLQARIGCDRWRRGALRRSAFPESCPLASSTERCARHVDPCALALPVPFGPAGRRTA